jgi:hypothetical protein
MSNAAESAELERLRDAPREVSIDLTEDVIGVERMDDLGFRLSSAPAPLARLQPDQGIPSEFEQIPVFSQANQTDKTTDELKDSAMPSTPHSTGPSWPTWMNDACQLNLQAFRKSSEALVDGVHAIGNRLADVSLGMSSIASRTMQEGTSVRNLHDLFSLQAEFARSTIAHAMGEIPAAQADIMRIMSGVASPLQVRAKEISDQLLRQAA